MFSCNSSMTSLPSTPSTEYHCEKSTPLIPPSPTSGTHKVKYHADDDWDFQLHVERTPVNLTLILPHYRAFHQPVGHKMNMLLRNRAGPTKLKICRNNPLSRFNLEVYSSTSDVTIWVPSDFKGRITYTGKAHFSAGFVNRIMRNARINEPLEEDHDLPDEDDIFVHTKGKLTFRMWDIQACAPENSPKESLKRLFGCTRRSPEVTFDWDFLIED